MVDENGKPYNDAIIALRMKEPEELVEKVQHMPTGLNTHWHWYEFNIE